MSIAPANAKKEARYLNAARTVIGELAHIFDLDARVRLWDGSAVPLGQNVTGPFEIIIKGPEVIGSLLRKPGLDQIIRQYAEGGIDFEGGTLLDLGRQLQDKKTRKSLKKINKLKLVKGFAPFLFAPKQSVQNAQGARTVDAAYQGEETGRNREQSENKDFVQFHYDLSNEFYALFLDPEMLYSCAYFKSWDNDIALAQHDKLEIICRKLRLKPGDKFLDIGSGWGGLICHAAQHYGVEAYGVTLSQRQFDYAQEKIKRLGLEERVHVELKDYNDLEGRFDKIASIGMYEHIGLANIPAYMKKVRGLLEKDGLFLNHAISRRAKKSARGWKRMRPEQKAIAKYIFPGGELDHIGHSVQAMEMAGFEVQDVEALREHYALTTQLWCERLTAQREQAIAEIGAEKYRIWVAYLAGVSLAFSRGTLRLYQTLASHNAKGPAPLPPTRDDLYR